ncbi:MAG: FG-GAP-like repeat-containing protein, partial [Planctomycetota bacterium]|nr:FG-GAP-like repeat-containing protein [Planctomycetota bacterium]
RGVGLMGQYRYADARAVFEQLVKEHPDWLDVKVNLAIATLNRQEDGDESLALTLLRDVLGTTPDHLRARYCAGLLLLRSGNETALGHLRFVAEADPHDAYALYFYASALEQMKRKDEALPLYQRTIEIDPYLRSGYYRLSQLLARSGRVDEGRSMQETFQKLDENPRARTVDFIYSKMGPKAEALAIDLDEPPVTTPPIGPIFAEPGPLVDDGEGYAWKEHAEDRPVSITACDIDNDGLLDIFIADALRQGDVANAVILNSSDGRFTLDVDHDLATVSAVNAALWGDFDNDGWTDVYLCRKGPNQLWRQVEPGKWADVSQSTRTANGDYDTVDGAFFDADHDGDLDIFCVNADGPNELLNNNLDGTFRPIAQERGIAGDGPPSRQVLVADLDHDRDADIIVINKIPPHEVYLNDRLWEYHVAEGFDALKKAQVRAAVAGDLDADGQVELYTIEPHRFFSSWQRVRWQADEDGGWQPAALLDPPDHGMRAPEAEQRAVVGGIALNDVTGDGSPNLIEFDAHGLAIWDAAGNGKGLLAGLVGRGDLQIVSWSPVLLDASAGPAIIGLPRNGPPLIWPPGPGRHRFAALTFTGMENPGQSMRSNASGIGAHIAVRVDSRWTVLDTFRNDSGPGQSLQPIAIGLGGAEKIDFIAIDWSDGVFQSEVHGIAPKANAPPRDLSAGHTELIEENQRQVSSCPVLFAWNGERYEFVSDLLGVGGLGYLVAPGEYAPPRPWENFLLPPGLLRPKDERYVLKLAEPMEEACYLDSMRLVSYDLPPGWKMTLDERMSILGPEPTGRPVFYRDEVLPVQAVNDRGEDVTANIVTADRRAAPVGALDRRFICRLQR